MFETMEPASGAGFRTRGWRGGAGWAPVHKKNLVLPNEPNPIFEHLRGSLLHAPQQGLCAALLYHSDLRALYLGYAKLLTDTEINYVIL